MNYAKTVEEYLEKSGDWQEALNFLRNLVQESGLEETVKWGAPVYCLKNKNIVGLGAFKAYVGLWFYQGALLQDKDGKLINAQEGVTKAMRQWRFQSLEEIKADVDLIRAYVQEAILNQQQGKEIKPDRKKPLVIPEELKALLEGDVETRQAFEGLSHGKKREYAEYISEAKRAATKEKRLEKITPMIREGVGLNDKYK